MCSSYLDADFLVHTLLLLLYLLFKLLNGSSVRRGAVRLEDLDVPVSVSVVLGGALRSWA